MSFSAWPGARRDLVLQVRHGILITVLALASSPAIAADPEITTPKQADAVAAALLGRLGSSYVARIDHDRKLLFISAIEKKQFEHTTALLAEFADAHHKSLLAERPRWYVTIILPRETDYAKMRPNVAAMGFYSPKARTLISIDRGRVLLHEFTHALHHADQEATGQQHPLWIAEGLATLFESAKITPGSLIVSTDGRIGWLRRAMTGGYLPPLAWLLQADSKQFMRDARTTYAYARYVMLYLHRKGKLPQWYRCYKANYAKDPSGRLALEKTLGKNLAAIDKAWQSWVARLNVPAAVRRHHTGRLGIQTADSPQGVRIVSMMARGAAAQAGLLRAGDAIVAVNNRPVRTVAELDVAMQATAPLSAVPITLRRNGHTLTVEHPMSVSHGRQTP